MKKLSVIIVNYNVRAYLEQCLRTVEKAMEGIDGEVYVVDNLSSDGSVEMVRDRFPQVRVIANRENVGFSRANNQAIRESAGEYVVLLNPDTVVGEDVFRKVVDFLDAHPKAGGLGVKMIDGTGHFLPESKRGLPTPAVAFFKIIGLTRLFPRSRVFGRYHLGHLAENSTAPIEILSGACMFLRRRTLDEVGLLDESFFMYGEDIDLSYRITLGGYENWYFPDARIIHYKGESTKKSSVNYVFVFYNAMAIFARKHFTRRGPDLFSWLIRGSIYLSAAGAIVLRFLHRALLPIADLAVLAAVIFGGSLLGGFSDADALGFAGGIYTVAGLHMLLSFGLFGAYDLPVRLKNVFLAAGIVAVYVFLVNLVRVGGGAVLKPAVWGMFAGVALALVGVATRAMLHVMRVRPFSLRNLDRKRILAIGSPEESRHALALLWQTHYGLGWKGEVDPATPDVDPGTIARTARRRWVDEVVFCARDIEWCRVIQWMEQLKRTGAEFKIMQPDRSFIIGPSSIESLHDLNILERHAVNSAEGRRTKRIADVAVCVLMLAAAPVVLFTVRDRASLLHNWWAVLTGRKSWVGYGAPDRGSVKLPAIKPGVLDPIRALGLQPLPIVVDRVNLAYAKDYSAALDLRIILRGFTHLGDR